MIISESRRINWLEKYFIIPECPCINIGSRGHTLILWNVKWYIIFIHAKRKWEPFLASKIPNPMHLPHFEKRVPWRLSTFAIDEQIFAEWLHPYFIYSVGIFAFLPDILNKSSAEDEVEPRVVGRVCICCGLKEFAKTNIWWWRGWWLKVPFYLVTETGLKLFPVCTHLILFRMWWDWY